MAIDYLINRGLEAHGGTLKSGPRGARFERAGANFSSRSGSRRALLLEITRCEFRLLLQRLTPAVASFIRLALSFERVSQIQQRFGKIRLLRERLLIQPDGI